MSKYALAHRPIYDTTAEIEIRRRNCFLVVKRNVPSCLRNGLSMGFWGVDRDRPLHGSYKPKTACFRKDYRVWQWYHLWVLCAKTKLTRRF